MLLGERVCKHLTKDKAKGKRQKAEKLDEEIRGKDEVKDKGKGDFHGGYHPFFLLKLLS